MNKKILMGLILLFAVATVIALVKSFRSQSENYQVNVGDVYVSDLFDADLASKAIRPTAFLVTKIVENKVFIKSKSYQKVADHARSKEEAYRQILKPDFFDQEIKMYIFELKDLEKGKMYFYLECNQYDEDYLNPKSPCYKDPSMLEAYPRLGSAVKIN